VFFILKINAIYLLCVLGLSLNKEELLLFQKNGEVSWFTVILALWCLCVVVWIAYTRVLVYSRFNLIKEVGDGTFGSVWRAINKQTGEVVSVLSFIATRIFSNFFFLKSPFVLFVTGCN
jgi:hypothetical protein